MSKQEKQAQAAAKADMEVTEPKAVEVPEITPEAMEVTEPKAVEAPEVTPEAIEAARKLLGLSVEAVMEGQAHDVKKVFESKKSQIETCNEIALLITKVKTFGAPIRIVIETNGETDTEPTKRITFPRSVPKSSMNTGNRGTMCRVDGIEYDAFSAACDAHNLNHRQMSGRVVLDAAKRNGKITSFEIV